ncbi:MAG TPA: serine--tRNA ligase [Acidimicrobiia bacterium]|jgi:seryl-tRNA synthetase|nr:serine--tRNA ligase [Acidimicrobiia bacterium]
MLDPRILRDDPDSLAESLRRRGSKIDLQELIALEAEHRAALQESERLRALQKDAGREIAALEGEAKEKAIAEVGELAEAVKESATRADELAERFNQAWIAVPNLVDPTAADGHTDRDNLEVKRHGEGLSEGADHATLGASLDIIDTERAAKVSGSRFGYLKGKGALLELSLVRWAMDHLAEAGFTPMIPPVLVREHALEGTGFFPEAREQVYEIPRDELFLVGTSEVPLAAYHGDEILEGEELPLRYAGFSTCFRREAGTYGKDTAGIFRVHQFDKVEMFVFTTPDASAEEHERLLGVEEELVRQLEVPYRVVNVAAGDLGASAAKKYDIEAWFPGEQAYREITSCSNTTDYQARRLRIRHRGDAGNTLVHTLNGTACAVGRTILALLENHQEVDGSVVIPTALRRYTGFDTIEP